jgi:hypothetical protein
MGGKELIHNHLHSKLKIIKKMQSVMFHEVLE